MEESTPPDIPTITFGALAGFGGGDELLAALIIGRINRGKLKVKLCGQGCMTAVI